MPPAFRNTPGGSDKDGDGLAGCGHARSLGEVAAADGQGGTRRFLSAALFLLAATSAAPSATTEIELEGGKKGEGSSGGTRAGGPALNSPLRSAARAAKARLGCDDCRVLSPESRAAATAAAGRNPAATAPADAGSSDEQCSTSSYETGTSGTSGTIHSDRDQEGGNGDTASRSDGWWARLRQVERGWISSETDQHEGPPHPKAGNIRDGESWTGLQFKLRPSDVFCVDGQTAIVDFLKGRVGKQVAGRGEEEEHAKGGENDSASSPKETHPQESPKPIESTASPAVGNISTAAGGEREAREGRSELLGRNSNSSGSSNSNSDNNDQRSPRAVATVAHAGAGQEPEVHLLRQAARGEMTVVVAVLVFGSELSKRDRAELHGQAEKAGGVASSSHGVGGGRFLSLTCGLGSRAGAVELELSPEKVRAVVAFPLCGAVGYTPGCSSAPCTDPPYTASSLLEKPF